MRQHELNSEFPMLKGGCIVLVNCNISDKFSSYSIAKFSFANDAKYVLFYGNFANDMWEYYIDYVVDNKLIGDTLSSVIYCGIDAYDMYDYTCLFSGSYIVHVVIADIDVEDREFFKCVRSGPLKNMWAQPRIVEYFDSNG